MMRVLMLLLLAFPQLPVGGPTQMQDPAYPLRVRILQRNGSRSAYGIRTWGRADLTVPQEQGFDYESDCSMLFIVSHGDELYQRPMEEAGQGTGNVGKQNGHG